MTERRGATSAVVIVDVDYRDPAHGEALLELLDDYARDPAGGGAALADDVRERLIGELAALPNAFSLLAYADTEDGRSPIGFANCFIGFSTFYAQPLINVHDLAVRAAWRGSGVAQRLLGRIEYRAAEIGCCKITLEVLQGNAAARGAYRKFGFSDYQLDPILGSALFMQKVLATVDGNDAH